MKNLNSLKRDVSANQVIYFVNAWIRHLNANYIINKNDFDLDDIVEKCFSDSRMFDSWFNGFDVMN